MIYDFLGDHASDFVVEHGFVPDLKNVFVSLQEKFKCAVGAQIMVKHLQATIVNNVEVKEMIYFPNRINVKDSVGDRRFPQ